VILQGGGPYGQEVTRGQDLSGRDFSGQTLIKQDFKTVMSLPLVCLTFRLTEVYISLHLIFI